jgi:hypothetical protein
MFCAAVFCPPEAEPALGKIWIRNQVMVDNLVPHCKGFRALYVEFWLQIDFVLFDPELLIEDQALLARTG